MRIGMILSTPMPPREGIGFFAKNLTQYIVDQGNQVQMITRGGPSPIHRRIINGITTWFVPFLPIYPLHVHFHSLFIQRVLGLIESELDLLHIHSPLVLPPKTKLPSLVTIHSPMAGAIRSIEIRDLASLLAKLQSPISIQIEKSLFAHANRLVATSPSVAQAMGLYGINPDCVGILGNGVDTAIFTPSGDNNQNQVPYFFSAGRLDQGKGFEDLFICAQLVVQKKPKVRFLVAGSGPFAEKYQRQIDKLHLTENVFLLGQIPDRSQMARLYQGAVAYVHPSHYEGLPTAILEAMACGKAVIASSVSGSKDLVEDGSNGLLVPSKDPVSLGEAMLELLSDRKYALELGHKGRELVLRKYTWKSIGRRYLEEYVKLLKEDASLNESAA